MSPASLRCTARRLEGRAACLNLFMLHCCGGLCSYREEVRIREKRVERYKDLLIEYYYRSDHVGISWKEAQDELKKCVARCHAPRLSLLRRPRF